MSASQDASFKQLCRNEDGTERQEKPNCGNRSHQGEGQKDVAKLLKVVDFTGVSLRPPHRQGYDSTEIKGSDSGLYQCQCDRKNFSYSSTD